MENKSHQKREITLEFHFASEKRAGLLKWDGHVKPIEAGNYRLQKFSTPDTTIYCYYHVWYHIEWVINIMREKRSWILGE